MSDSKTTHTLETPVVHGEKEISVLEFRAPTGADLDDFPIGSVTFADYRRVASRLCGVPANVLRQATGHDTVQIISIVDGLLSPGRAPGGSSS